MTETVTKLIETSLSQAGFTPIEEYDSDTVSAEYTAYWQIAEISLGELNFDGSTAECSADFEIKVHALGAKRDFSDKKTLEQMVQSAASYLIFSSSLIVKKLCCGGVSKNMRLGRLEYEMSITLCTSIKKGA
jgi:hypothetical protein